MERVLMGKFRIYFIRIFSELKKFIDKLGFESEVKQYLE